MISIHALLTEGDVESSQECFKWGPISIHALLTEGDKLLNIINHCITYFNPRPPHGGRLDCEFFCKSFIVFQSTPSSRRATAKMTNLSFFNFTFLPKAYIFLI